MVAKYIPEPEKQTKIFKEETPKSFLLGTKDFIYLSIIVLLIGVGFYYYHSYNPSRNISSYGNNEEFLKITNEKCNSKYLLTRDQLNYSFNSNKNLIYLNGDNSNHYQPSKLVDIDELKGTLTLNNQVLNELVYKLGDNPLYILSAIGVGRNGKSTILNQLIRILANIDEDYFITGAGAVSVTKGVWLANLLIPYKEGYAIVIDCEGVGMENVLSSFLSSVLSAISSETLLLIRGVPSKQDYSVLAFVLNIVKEINSKINFILTGMTEFTLKSHDYSAIQIIIDGIKQFHQVSDMENVKRVILNELTKDGKFSTNVLYLPSLEELSVLNRSSVPVIYTNESSTCYQKSFVATVNDVLKRFDTPMKGRDFKQKLISTIDSINGFSSAWRDIFNNQFEIALYGAVSLKAAEYCKQFDQQVLADMNCQQSIFTLERNMEDLAKKFLQECKSILSEEESGYSNNNYCTEQVIALKKNMKNCLKEWSSNCRTFWVMVNDVFNIIWPLILRYYHLIIIALVLYVLYSFLTFLRRIC
ncbi:hypothetical protein ABK040_013998 [Willaertia magna]